MAENVAASFMKKTMAYLGLVDDDYDDFDDFEPPTSSGAPVGRTSQRPVAGGDDVDEPTTAIPTPRASVRCRRRTRWITVAPAPAESWTTGDSGNLLGEADLTGSVSCRVHIVAPGRFADAQEIANRLMNSQPVIVNMQSAERDLQRRMIDFCMGVTYALSGGMERVADEVFCSRRQCEGL